MRWRCVRIFCGAEHAWNVLGLGVYSSILIVVLAILCLVLLVLAIVVNRWHKKQTLRGELNNTHCRHHWATMGTLLLFLLLFLVLLQHCPKSSSQRDLAECPFSPPWAEMTAFGPSFVGMVARCMKETIRHAHTPTRVLELTPETRPHARGLSQNHDIWRGFALSTCQLLVEKARWS